MTKTTKQPALTLTERLAQIESQRRETLAAIDRLDAAWRERDLRVTTLLGQ